MMFANLAIDEKTEKNCTDGFFFGSTGWASDTGDCYGEIRGCDLSGGFGHCGGDRFAYGAELVDQRLVDV